MKQEVRRARKQRRADLKAGPARPARPTARAMPRTRRRPREARALVRGRGRRGRLRDGPRPPGGRGVHRRGPQRPVAGLTLGARMFRDEVAQGQAEDETELRERFGLVPHGAPELAVAAADRRSLVSTSSTDEQTQEGEQLMDTAEIRRRFVAHFEARRAHRRALGLAAARRPEPAVRQRRHGAVQALLPRPGDAAVRPRGERAEVRAHPRHRGRRQDHPARHVLRDVRQLLLRRLLQGGRDRATPGTWSPSPRPTAAGGSRRAGCGRRSCTATTRRCTCG